MNKSSGDRLARTGPGRQPGTRRRGRPKRPEGAADDADHVLKPVGKIFTQPAGRVYPGQGHVYTPVMWAKTLAWFDDHLCGPEGRP